MPVARCLVASLVGAVGAVGAIASGGCQERDSGKRTGAATAAADATAIEVRDPDGQVTARIVPGTTCHATIGTVDAMVTDNRAQLGGDTWTVTDAVNGAIVRKGDTKIARAYSAVANELAVMDATGIASFRASTVGGTATIVSGAGVALREVHAGAGRDSAVLAADDRRPIARVTQTSDLLLAALVSAPEVAPEVRALLACHRLQAPPAAPQSVSEPSPAP